ncbi:cytidine deaminase [Glutamicibacter mishrai]|uniref:cytidine deaminase n=1 Tax=Glutamicibacter mishrai TaxID=1775880 RepID=UPI0020CDABC7|nr:cytidine deaminase [Glutamicibacter mishrai]UTT40877.1 cytidine deaminase [Glutamicibacter mishrai]
MKSTPHELHCRELAEAEVELVELARRTIEAVTDAPDGGDGMHTMGAAVLAADGTMHAGVNFYHFTGGPCAELVALGAARAAGAVDPQVVVAVGNQGRGIKNPCGRCRQVMADSYPRLRVIVQTPAGARSIAIGELLPWSFDWVAEQA